MADRNDSLQKSRRKTETGKWERDEEEGKEANNRELEATGELQENKRVPVERRRRSDLDRPTNWLAEIKSLQFNCECVLLTSPRPHCKLNVRFYLLKLW